MSQNEHFPKLSLFLGGARSGKSILAEKLVIQSSFFPVYIATAEIRDAEMAARIESHNSRRGDKWQLIEAPIDLAGPLGKITEKEIVLIDCLTLWLSNTMIAGVDLAKTHADLLLAIKNCAGKVVCVSNEVGMGIVPENKLAREFRDAQGELNQKIAAVAELVVFSAAGLPMVLKGNMPGATT